MCKSMAAFFNFYAMDQILLHTETYIRQLDRIIRSCNDPQRYSQALNNLYDMRAKAANELKLTRKLIKK